MSQYVEVVMRKDTYEELIELAKLYAPKIICGFVSGRKEGKTIIVDDIYPIPTRSGPMIHFKPKSWKVWGSVKGYIKEVLGKEVIAEFHTHPYNIIEPNTNDKKIMRTLGRALWIIATPNEVAAWLYDVYNKEDPGPLRIRIRTIHEFIECRLVKSFNIFWWSAFFWYCLKYCFSKRRHLFSVFYQIEFSSGS